MTVAERPSPSRRALALGYGGLLPFAGLAAAVWGLDGHAYPAPIVDDKTAMKAAKDRIYGLRQSQAARDEDGAVQARHGSRKSGLPPSGSRRSVGTRRAATAAAPSPQGDLFA
jgi:hypothetical protein